MYFHPLYLTPPGICYSKEGRAKRHLSTWYK